MPWSPPMHRVTMPRLRPSRRIERMRRVVSTAPVARMMAMRDRTTLDVTEFPPGAAERLAHCGDWSKAEHPRLHRRDAVGDEARCRTEAAAFREILIRQYHCSSRTVEAGRIAGSDRSIRAKCRFQRRQRRQRRFRPVVLSSIVNTVGPLRPGTSTATHSNEASGALSKPSTMPSR